MLKLKLQYFDHLMWRTDSFEKTLMLEKTEVMRRRGWQRIRWLGASLTQWTWVWVSSGSWWLTGKPGVLQSMGLQRFRHNWSIELYCWLLWFSGKPGFIIANGYHFPIVVRQVLWFCLGNVYPGINSFCFNGSIELRVFYVFDVVLSGDVQRQSFYELFSIH